MTQIIFEGTFLVYLYSRQGIVTNEVVNVENPFHGLTHLDTHTSYLSINYTKAVDSGLRCFYEPLIPKK